MDETSMRVPATGKGRESAWTRAADAPADTPSISKVGNRALISISRTGAGAMGQAVTVFSLEAAAGKACAAKSAAGSPTRPRSPAAPVIQQPHGGTVGAAV